MNIKKLPEKILLQGGVIVDPKKERENTGDILLINGNITEIGDIKSQADFNVLDCSGYTITPGFCDIHVHFREPGREDKETLASGSNAALAGGFTRVCVMPNTNPPLDNPEAIGYIVDKSQSLPAHIHPIGAVTQQQKGTQLTEMGGMFKAGAVAFSDDGMPITNGYVMRMALDYASMFSVPLINHAEDVELRYDGLMNEGLVSTELGLSGNPALAEVTMVYRDLELAALTKSKLHVPHVSTAGAANQIKKFKIASPWITAEVTPHHLFFNDEALKSFDTNLKVAPPIRSEEDRLALIKAVLDGVFDCIATDHAPHTIEEKEGTFDLAPFGMIGLESCFGAVNKVLVEENELPFIDLIKMLTVNPRQIMSFDDDLLKIGKEAELTILNRREKVIFSKDDIHSKSQNSPYLGHELIGKIRYTISKGRIATI